MSVLPIGVCIRTIRAEPRWWLESARRLDEAGYAGVWAWDHFMGRGDPTVPVVESWTILTAAAATTSRVTVGPFVDQRHEPPPGRARPDGLDPPDREWRPAHPRASASAATRPSTSALGIPFPAAPERVARVEEAVAVLRALWAGGPVTRPSPYYPLVEPTARPIPEPPPRIIIGGETAAGARLAGRIGDGWTTFDDNFEANLPLYLEALEATGRRRADQLVLVGSQGDWLDDVSIAGSPWVTDPRATWQRWHEAGADGAIVTAKSTADIDALVEAAERW